MTYRLGRGSAALSVLALACGTNLVVAQTAPVILVSSTALTFNTGLGQNPDVQSVFVGSSGAPLTLQVGITTTIGGPWLRYSSDSSTTPANLRITPETAGLPSGAYKGQIQISAAGASNSPLTINVTVTVAGGTTSQLTAAPASLNFSAQLNGNPPPSQQIAIGSGTSTIGFTTNVSTSGTGTQWLHVDLASGNTPQILNVSVDPQGLTGGTYTGTINIIPNAQGVGPISVVVNLSVSTLPTLNIAPAGGFQFFFQTGTTSAPPIQGLTLSTTSGTLSMNLQATTGNGLPWLGVGQTQAIVGTTPLQIPISISPIVSTFPAGTYSGTINIAAPGATNSSIAVSVTLQVTSLPLISLGSSPSPFNYRYGSPVPQPQNVQIGVSSGQTPYNASVVLPPGQNWLAVSPDSGILPTSLSVAVDPSGLSSGTYSGQVKVDAQGVANSPILFSVTLTVSANGVIIVSPPALSFNFQIGKGAPPKQTLNVGTAGGTTHFDIQTSTNNCGANWLSATPVSATAPTTLAVSIDPAGMSSATLCTGRISILNQAGTQTQVPVNLNVSTDPLMNIAPPILTFTGVTGGSLPATQSIALTSTDPNSPISYATVLSTSNGGGWLAIGSNASGSTPVSLPIVVNQGTLAPGSYSGIIEIRPSGIAPFRVPVTLNVSSNISVGVAPPSISFNAAAGTSPSPQVLTVSSLGGTLPFSASALSGVNWLSVSPTSSASTPGQLIVSANTSTLAPGSYDGSITISSQLASNPSLSVPVSLTIGQAQTLSVSPLALSFSYSTGDPTPASQTIILAPSAGAIDFRTSAQISGSGNWLQVSPANGTSPAGITVTVDPTGLAPATYTGTITITPNGLQPVVVTVSFNISGPPLPSLSTVVNAASLLDGAIAPGEIVTLSGANTGTSGDRVIATPNPDGSYPLTIGDTQVFFDTFAAPILAIQTNQVTVIVPYEIAGQASTLIQVKRKSVFSNPVQIQVAPSAPGIFTVTVPAQNVGVILNADGTPNSADNPAPVNSPITIYYTGEGQTDPPSVTNTLNPTTQPYPAPLAVLTATMGGATFAAIPSYGPVPGMIAGVSTATITVPPLLGPGAQPLYITSGTAQSQLVTVYVSN